MAGAVRYNKAIEVAGAGKPVFCSGLVWNGNLDDICTWPTRTTTW